MRKKIFYILIPFLVILAACEKDEFLEFEKAEAVIQFTGFPAFAGTFTTLDEVIVPVTTDNASSLDVSVLVDNEPTSFTQTASAPTLTVQDSWSNLLGGASIESLDGDDITLRVTATANGESSYKDLSLSYSNPLSLDYSVGDDDFITASTAFPDSSFNVYYNVNTLNATVENVDFFAKIGESTDYPMDPFATEAINATTAEEQTLSFAFPDEDSIGFGDDFFIKAVAIGANGLTDEIEFSIEAVEVPLDDEGTFVLFPDNFVVTPSVPDDPETPEDESSPAVFDTENNGFDFSESELVADASGSADIRLGIDNGSLVLDLANGIEYVIQDGTKAVNGYQSARDLFMAGTASTTQIENLAELNSNPEGYIILSIPDLASVGTGSSEYVTIRIENVIRNAEVIDQSIDPINNSTVTISYQGNLP